MIIFRFVLVLECCIVLGKVGGGRRKINLETGRNVVFVID